MVEEIWKDIAGYEGLYQVSNFGRVKSLAKLCGHRPKGETILNIQDTRGYKRVTLCKDNKLKKFQIHRLVAIAFIENPENKPCINHKDENKANNNVDNLEWVTWKENTNYGHCIENCHKKLTPTIQKKYGQRVKCLETGDIFQSLKDAAKWCNGNWSCISACIKGKVKTHRGYHWEKIGHPLLKIGFGIKNKI